MSRVVRLLTRPFSVLGRRALAGAVVLRLAPFTFMALRARRVVDPPGPVVSVIGSFGKTTTTQAIRAAVGLPLRAQRGTSVAFAAWHLLRRRVGRSLFVIEAGIERPGQMRPAAAALRPDAVVVTSIGHEHLLSFRTLERVRAEKAEMVRALPSTGVTFLNGDDPHVLWMRAVAPGRVVTFGFGAHCDVVASEPRIDWPTGMTVDVIAHGQPASLRLLLVGRPAVYAALAAVAVAIEFGIDVVVAADRLSRLQPVPGRLQPVPTPSGATVLRDDFKSNWETVVAGLDLVAALPVRRRFIVLGEVTEPPSPQRAHYRQLGARAGAVADRLIVVGDQGRAYRSGATSVGMDRASILDAGTSVFTALSHLPGDLGPDDLVFVKGRRVQRMERVALSLQGYTVGCRVVTCRAVMTTCDICPRLEAGWPDGRVEA